MATAANWKQMAFYLRGVARNCNAVAKDELLALARDCDELAADIEKLGARERDPRRQASA